MSCFIAPAAVAIATTVAQKYAKKREHGSGGGRPAQSTRVARWSERLRWLSALMWSGTLLLVLEHALHGELMAAPPFFTALQTPGQLGPMLQEIATAGVALVAGIVMLWALLIAIAEQRGAARRSAADRM